MQCTLNDGVDDDDRDGENQKKNLMQKNRCRMAKTNKMYEFYPIDKRAEWRVRFFSVETKTTINLNREAEREIAFLLLHCYGSACVCACVGLVSISFALKYLVLFGVRYTTPR